MVELGSLAVEAGALVKNDSVLCEPDMLTLDGRLRDSTEDVKLNVGDDVFCVINVLSNGPEVSRPELRPTEVEIDLTVEDAFAIE